MVDMSVLRRLSDCFPKGAYRKGEFIITDNRVNESFILDNCEDELDVKCKVLEWLSRAACKTEMYRDHKKNREYQDKMRECINRYLGTEFTWEQMLDIYAYMGNRIHHSLTVEFVTSGYDFGVIEKFKRERGIYCG